jgi:SPP1 gp7 family putative phage head morphogenesis protein
MWLDWIEKSQKQAEDGIRRRVNGYFRGARRRFVRLVEENTQQGLLDVVRAQKEEELRLLKQGYQGEFVKWFMLTGSSELDRVFRIADVARPLDLVFGRRDLAVQLSDRAAQQMTDTTINSVESIIQRGLIAGASVPQIASNLSNSLAFSQDRSLRIARTESTKAVNAATDQAYRQAATAGIDIQKQWLSSRDAKVREAHQALDGVVVGVNEEFESEGYTSPLPANFGDPSLDVNCRCTIVPVIDGKTDL